MTEKMFQEREVPWHMDKENGAELEELNIDEFESYNEFLTIHGFAPDWRDVEVKEGE